MLNIFKTNLEKFNKIKIEYVKKGLEEMLKLLTQVIINQDFNKLTIEIYDINGNYLCPNIQDKVSRTINNIIIILGIFNKDKFILLKDLLIHLFNKNCESYSNIMNFITEDKIYKIKYNNISYIYKHVQILDNISHIRYCAVSKTFY